MIFSKVTPLAAAVMLINTQVVWADAKVIYHQDTITVIEDSDRDSLDSGQFSSTITKEEIGRYPQSGITDVLSSAVNVDVLGGPSSASQNISIRGLPQSHARIYIDGIYQSNYATKKGSWSLNPFLINQIKITNGPSSGAAAGKIGISTISAKTELEPGDDFGGKLSTAYRSNGQQKDTNLALYGQKEGFDWLVSAHSMEKGAYEIGGGGSYDKTAAREKALLLKFGQQFTPDKRLDMSFNYDDGHGNQVREDIGYRDSTYKGGSFVWTDKGTGNDWLDLTAVFYFNNVDSYTYEESNAKNSGNLITGVQDISDKSLGFSVANNSLFSLGGDNKHIAHYGLSGHFTKHRGYIAETDTVTGVVTDESAQSEADANRRLGSIWLNTQLNVSDNWDVTPGIRYDSFNIKSSNAIDANGNPLLRDGRTESRISKSLLSNYYLNDNVTLFAGYSEALNAPRDGHLFTSGRGFKPNPELKSERADNIEVGAVFDYQGVFDSEDSLVSQINIFRNDIKDYIGTEYTDPNYKDGVKVNIGNVRLEGVELKSDYSTGKWTLGASFASTKGTDLTTGWYLTDMPSNKLKFKAQYAYSDNLSIGARATHAFSFNNSPAQQYGENGVIEPATTQNVGAWQTLDLYANYTPAAMKNLNLGLSVTNVFDESYALRSEWNKDGSATDPVEYFEDGRSVNLTLNYKF